jgi:hypothetical protein
VIVRHDDRLDNPHILLIDGSVCVEGAMEKEMTWDVWPLLFVLGSLDR